MYQVKEFDEERFIKAISDLLVELFSEPSDFNKRYNVHKIVKEIRIKHKNKKKAEYQLLWQLPPLNRDVRTEQIELADVDSNHD